MKNESRRVISQLTRWSPVLVYVVLMVATLVLAGWLLQLDFLKRVIPGVVAMNPLTALLFILTSVAFLLQRSSQSLYRTLGRGVAMVVILVATVKIIEYSIGVEAGIDTWFFRSQLMADQNGISNRMAINTSCCFVLVGTIVVLVRATQPWVQRVTDYLAMTNLFVALLSLIGYLYIVDVFYALLAYVPMALHTAINFMLLSLAVVFGRPRQGFMKEITSPWAGGYLGRRLIPEVFLIPILLGWVIVLGEWQQLSGLDFGLAIFCLGSIFLFLMLGWRAIKALNRFDQKKDEAEKALRQANQTLEGQATQLEISNRELESFSYSVSHDLRAPLRAIGGYTQLLLEDHHPQLSDSGKEMLEIVARNAEKMTLLIDELLRFSKVGKAGIRRSTLDMEQIASETFKLLTTADNQLPIIEISSMPSAQADYNLVTLLYQNLISNAIKYSAKKPAPRITVGADTQSPTPVYYVRDNGAGFNMQYYDKLFGVFHRLHKQTEFEGTGVGLAIAQKIVLAHEGDIWAESVPGEGATFYFTLAKNQHSLQEA